MQVADGPPENSTRTAPDVAGGAEIHLFPLREAPSPSCRLEVALQSNQTLAVQTSKQPAYKSQSSKHFAMNNTLLFIR